MAIQFSAVGTRAQSASAATLSPAKPTVGGNGGVLIAVVSSKNNAAHSTATAGWVMIGSQQNSGVSFTQSIWIALETAAAPVFTWTGAVACQAQITYYFDPTSNIDTSIAAASVSAGTTSTHTSTSINTTRANSLVVYIDTAAANTALATPAGWTEDNDVGSGTDAGRTVFGSKAIAVSGSASGAISVIGANAAWVQRQVELRQISVNGLLSSKMETGVWLDPLPGVLSSKMEVIAWLDILTGVVSSKLEVVAWLDVASTSDNPGFCSILW